MAYLGPNKFGEDVYDNAFGGRVVKKYGQWLGAISGPTDFDPFNSIEDRYKTVLELVESTCREHDHDISGIGAVAAVREMAKYWDAHLREGTSKEVVLNDLNEVKSRIDLILEDLKNSLGTPKLVAAA